MIETIEFLLSGIVLGLVAGISPGPTLTLVISETFKYNKKEGIKIALAPLFTDVPIAVITILIISRISDYDLVLAIISFLGAAFILYLAYESIRVKPVQVADVENHKSQSIKKGIIANFLSPHAYLFWILIGAPTTIKAYKINLLAPILFIAGFYLLLVGMKIIIAIVSEKSKSILRGNTYLYIIKALGIILFFFALILARDGLRFIGAL